MADRGEYRSIRRVLLDGPDFQRLSERARFVFLALKINAGPAGLELEYDRGLVEKVGTQTGMGSRAVRKALVELEFPGQQTRIPDRDDPSRGQESDVSDRDDSVRGQETPSPRQNEIALGHGKSWIVREGNLLWLVGHLDNEPLIRSTDDKHRKGIQRYVAGLPRLNIVRSFIINHPKWFPEKEAKAFGLAWVFDDPPQGSPQGSRKGVATTENREPRTITENREPMMEGPPSAAPSSTAVGTQRLHTALESDADRDALSSLLNLVENPRTWCAEMAASLDGMAGHEHVTAVQLGTAIRDYVGNGAVKRANLREFRRYLRLARKPLAHESPRHGGSPPASKQEIGRQNLADAVERRAREKTNGD